jgi:hypothetical protein
MADAVQARRARRRLYIVAGVLVAVVVGAWIVERVVNGAAQAPGGAPAAPAYTVSVQRDGMTLKRFTVAQLHALPQTHIMSDGKPQDGPSLAVVLAAAGFRGTYTSLDIRGMGLRDGGRLALPAARVTPKTILDFSDRGTLKVVSPSLTFRERVRDVTAIIVR